MNLGPSSSSPRRDSPPFPHLTIAISHSYSIGWLMDDIMSYVPPPPLLRITLLVNQPYDYHFNHMVARSITGELLWPKPSISPFHMITSSSLPSISQALPPPSFAFFHQSTDTVLQCTDSICWTSPETWDWWVKCWPGESSSLPKDIQAVSQTQCQLAMRTPGESSKPLRPSLSLLLFPINRLI